MLYKRWKGRLLLFLAGFFAAVLFFSQAAAAGRIEDKVLRLHVIANSDSEEDQALKLKVRDQVLATLKPLLENAEDRSSSEAIVRAHLSEVEAAARETAWQEKPGENVHAELTNTRSSGSDEALKLTPPKIMSLEQCLEFIDSDELLEVTPKSLRIRKKILDSMQRKRASFKNKNA